MSMMNRIISLSTSSVCVSLPLLFYTHKSVEQFAGWIQTFCFQLIIVPIYLILFEFQLHIHYILHSSLQNNVTSTVFRLQVFVYVNVRS